MRIAQPVFALALALLVLGLLGFSACSRKAGPRLKIAATIFPIYDLTRTIAGPDADVILFAPPGVSVHDGNSVPRSADALAGAKLGIMVGLGLDEWMKALFDEGAPTARRLIVGDRVPTLPLRQNLTDTQFEAKPDPHVWLDPARAMLISKAIAEEMARADPAHATAYRNRSFALQQDLDALDHEIERRVAMWASRSFVSFDPAFTYYADRYHLNVTASVEPALGVSPSLVADAANVAIRVLDPLGGQAETDTYDKLIRFDTDALEAILRYSPSIEDSGARSAFRPAGDGSAPP